MSEQEQHEYEFHGPALVRVMGRGINFVDENGDQDLDLLLTDLTGGACDVWLDIKVRWPLREGEEPYK